MNISISLSLLLFQVFGSCSNHSKHAQIQCVGCSFEEVCVREVVFQYKIPKFIRACAPRKYPTMYTKS